MSAAYRFLDVLVSSTCERMVHLNHGAGDLVTRAVERNSNLHGVVVVPDDATPLAESAAATWTRVVGGKTLTEALGEASSVPVWERFDVGVCSFGAHALDGRLDRLDSFLTGVWDYLVVAGRAFVVHSIDDDSLRALLIRARACGTTLQLCATANDEREGQLGLFEVRMGCVNTPLAHPVELLVPTKAAEIDRSYAVYGEHLEYLATAGDIVPAYQKLGQNLSQAVNLTTGRPLRVLTVGSGADAWVELETLVQAYGAKVPRLAELRVIDPVVDEAALCQRWQSFDPPVQIDTLKTHRSNVQSVIHDLVNEIQATSHPKFDIIFLPHCMYHQAVFAVAPFLLGSCLREGGFGVIHMDSCKSTGIMLTQHIARATGYLGYPCDETISLELVHTYLRQAMTIYPGMFVSTSIEDFAMSYESPSRERLVRFYLQLFQDSLTNPALARIYEQIMEEATAWIDRAVPLSTTATDSMTPEPSAVPQRTGVVIVQKSAVPSR